MQRVPTVSLREERVKSWRFTPGELVVEFAGHGGECCPICVCGRAHWFPRVVHAASGARELQISCHHCGHRDHFALE